MLQITLSSSWKDIKKLIKEDPRYSKFSSSDRVCISKEIKSRMILTVQRKCRERMIFVGETFNGVALYIQEIKGMLVNQ